MAHDHRHLEDQYAGDEAKEQASDGSIGSGDGPGEQREARDVGRIGNPLSEIELARFVQGSPEKREAPTQFSDVQRRDQRSQLGERPEADRDET